MTKTLTCIGCPLGCLLTATLEDGCVTEVTGNTCKRGDMYARKECVSPSRIVTGTVRLCNASVPVLSVKTASEVPKEKVLDVARALCDVIVHAPVSAGDVIVANIADTNVDVIATKNAD